MLKRWKGPHGRAKGLKPARIPEDQGMCPLRNQPSEGGARTVRSEPRSAEPWFDPTRLAPPDQPSRRQYLEDL